MKLCRDVFEEKPDQGFTLGEVSSVTGLGKGEIGALQRLQSILKQLEKDEFIEKNEETKNTC